MHKKNTLTRLLLAATAALGAGTAHAETQAVLNALVTGGGETLATVEYTDGTSKDISSGGLIQLSAGLEYRQADSPVAVQVTLGYHVDNSTASNGSVRFSRFPLEALVMWQPQDWLRAGVGFRKALNADLRSSGAASSVGNFDFKSQLGMVVQGEYVVNRNFSIVLRWVSEKYEVNGADIDGSHVGLGMSVRF